MVAAAAAAAAEATAQMEVWAAVPMVAALVVGEEGAGLEGCIRCRRRTRPLAFQTALGT